LREGDRWVYLSGTAEQSRTPRGRQVNVEPHNAVSCLRLVFAAHTSCVCASWRLLPGSLTRLPGARSGRPPEWGRPDCGTTACVTACIIPGPMDGSARSMQSQNERLHQTTCLAAVRSALKRGVPHTLQAVDDFLSAVNSTQPLRQQLTWISWRSTLDCTKALNCFRVRHVDRRPRCRR